MPPPPPTSYSFSQLSLGSMPPPTRQDDSNWDSEFDEDLNTITFPSQLTYSLDNLKKHEKKQVIDEMGSATQIVLQACQARDQGIIFQVSELVEHCVRTPAPNSEKPGLSPDCSCDEETPCRHILWLLDQISRQILPDQDEPLDLNADGYPNELGNPYDSVSQFHLDVLADSLHSQVASSPVDGSPSPRRVQEAREILASLNATPVDDYRRDLFDSPKKGANLVKMQDLECTIFRMLVDNNEFFDYFLSNMAPNELVKNRFRRLQQRADAVLNGLDTYVQGQLHSSARSPKDVDWCANHMLLIVRQVSCIIQHTDTQLADWELRSAARTLVHVLEEVVARNTDNGPANQDREKRNLFFRLIGNKDIDFVVGALGQIPPAPISPLVGNLEGVLGVVLKYGAGAPPSYVDKIRRLISRSRILGVSASSGSKRQGGEQNRGAKRMK